MRTDRKKLQWGCHFKDFHNLLKKEAADRGITMLDYEKILSEEPDILKAWEEAGKEKKRKFQFNI